jgi:hypothetical protein
MQDFGGEWRELDEIPALGYFTFRPLTEHTTSVLLAYNSLFKLIFYFNCYIDLIRCLCGSRIISHKLEYVPRTLLAFLMSNRSTSQNVKDESREHYYYIYLNRSQGRIAKRASCLGISLTLFQDRMASPVAPRDT